MVAEPVLDISRGHWRIENAESFTDSLGALGAWVGPRVGKDRRTKEQKELYCLRHFLVAMKTTDSLGYPVDIVHVADGKGPDFRVSIDSGEAFGLEVTEAGDRNHQEALTHSETSDDLYQHDIWKAEASQAFAAALSAKTEKGADGRYGVFGACDLLIYDNTRSGPYLDDREILTSLRAAARPNTVFRRVHILSGDNLHFDIFGNGFQSIQVGGAYEIDFAKWIRDQIEAVRSAHGEGLDIEHLIEELEGMSRKDRKAFLSHLSTLLMHLLKWRYQPERRGASWEITINNARDELADLLAENPSFANNSFLTEQIARAYGRARRNAATETGIEVDAFPATCPFTDDDIFNEAFFPDSAE